MSKRGVPSQRNRCPSDARVVRVGFGVWPRHAFDEVRDGRNAVADARDPCDIRHARIMFGL